ncbi:MAG: hypothetical protein SGI77_12595 [Pirellulaceae bacterium]|nr:hypothetical protein [Pirellulaceae bacterium]
MRLFDAITQFPKIPIFGRIEGLETDDDGEGVDSWHVDPIDAPVLLQSEISQFFIVKAIQVLPSGTTRECYIDIQLPERATDYAYFVGESAIDFDYPHNYEGEIISKVPIDSFGIYELFYSKTLPDIGIEVLRRGLPQSKRKSHIAQDLGYIFRDERRYAEAAQAFQISADEGPSSYFIYDELSGCYEKIGEHALAQKYDQLFRKRN